MCIVDDSVDNSNANDDVDDDDNSDDVWGVFLYILKKSRSYLQIRKK